MQSAATTATATMTRFLGEFLVDAQQE